MPRLPVVAFALTMTWLALVSAQSPPSQPNVVAAPARRLSVFADLQNWIQLSKTHRVGEMDDALRAVAKLPLATIQAVDRDLHVVQNLISEGEPGLVFWPVGGRKIQVADLAALFDLPDALFIVEARRLLTPAELRQPDNAARQAIARILVRAAMLHTDFLTSTSREQLIGGSTSGSVASSATVRVVDGERRVGADFNAYWRAARTAMDLAQPTAFGGPLVRDWYVATAQFLVSQRDYASALPHGEHAREMLPNDGWVALYLGAAYENLAAPPIQASYQNGEGALTAGARPTLLRRAEYQLRSALLLDPELGDPALRLGRTLVVLARPDEALPFLARAEREMLRAEPRYFAALFTGIAQAELGNAADAKAAFGRAAALFPQAQTPGLAMAQLAMLTSERAQALKALAPLSAKPELDPWWMYDVDLTWSVAERLDIVRAAIRERLR